jgi:hypothetical protein
VKATRTRREPQRGQRSVLSRSPSGKARPGVPHEHGHVQLATIDAFAAPLFTPSRGPLAHQTVTRQPWSQASPSVSTAIENR